MTTARIADVYVEAVILPRTRVRVADAYTEVVIYALPLGGWQVGMLPM